MPCKIHYLIKGVGKPVVFFHGWGFDHQIWQGLSTDFISSYQLFLVDLPGFGKSAQQSWDEFKNGLLSLLPKKFALVGWSMGGLFATRLAWEAPERVTHLLNIASSPKFIQDDHWPGIEPSIFHNFCLKLAENHHTVIDEFIKLQTRGMSPNFLTPTLPTTNLESLKMGMHILSTWDLRWMLSEFQIPVAYLFGRLDAITPVQTYSVIQERYPHIDCHLIRKAAHMPFLSHQEACFDLFEEFLL